MPPEAKRLVELLKQLSDGPAEATVRELLSVIESLPDNHLMHPFTELAMALRNGLTYEDHWKDVPGTTYAWVAALFEKYLTVPLNDNRLGRAIIQLDDWGIETTPFGKDFDWSELE